MPIAAPEVAFERCVRVSYQGRTWTTVPSKAGGIDFVELSANDGEFSRLACGTTRGLVGNPILGVLRIRRHEKGMAASNVGMFEDEGGDIYRGWRKRKRLGDLATSATEQARVMVDMPRCARYEPRAVKIRWTPDLKAQLAIEFDEDILCHVLQLIHESDESSQRKARHKKCPTGVKWHKHDRVYTARRSEGETAKFKVVDFSDAHAARSAAMAWAKGGEVEGAL